MPDHPPTTILCVDDSPDARLSTTLLLRAEGYHVREAYTPTALAAKVREVLDGPPNPLPEDASK